MSFFQYADIYRTLDSYQLEIDGVDQAIRQIEECQTNAVASYVALAGNVNARV